MTKLLRIIWIDLRSILRIKALWIGLIVIGIYTLLIFYATRYSEELKIPNFYYQIINGLSFYLLLIVPALTLSKDYELKTIRMLYTGIFSKIEIVISKLVSMVIFYLLFGFTHRLSANLLWMMGQNKFSFELLAYRFWLTTGIYLINGLFICLLAFLITLWTYSRWTTLIFMFSIFFFERVLRGILSFMFFNPFMITLLNHNPFAVSFESLHYSTISYIELYILLLAALPVGILILTLLNKKEMS